MAILSKNHGGRKTPGKTKLEQFEYFERLSEEPALQWQGNCVDFFVVSTNLPLSHGARTRQGTVETA
jgi:hypothetical protein